MKLENMNSNSEKKVLDHGFVKLIDFMGNDTAIVDSARVSYGAGTKKTRADRTLIRYLLRQGHLSPFEMVEFKFMLQLPLIVQKQLIRTRTANVNEYSGRYSEMLNLYYLPNKDRLVTQSSTNKQCSSNKLVDNVDEITDRMTQEQNLLRTNYEFYLESGLSRETARDNLPISQYTKLYWKLDLRNLFNFLNQRLDSHAQWEIRQYAEAMYSLIKPIVPTACEAFEDYILNSVTLSKLDVKAVNKLLNYIETFNPGPRDWQEEVVSSVFSNKREKNEFLDKYNKLFK